MTTDGTFDISVFCLYNTDWSENDVTWNNFNASILQEGGNFQGGVDDKGKIFEVDVTDLVKHDASNLKVTLLLEAKRSNVNIWISSSESKSGTPPTLLLSCVSSDKPSPIPSISQIPSLSKEMILNPSSDPSIMPSSSPSFNPSNKPSPINGLILCFHVNTG